MAQLPDIDTSNVSFLAYWNALNNGVSDIDPSEVTNDPNVQTVEVYDNGVQGDYKLVNDRPDARYRVKEDGWFVVWLDRSSAYLSGQNYYPEARSEIYGPFDISPAWMDRGSISTWSQHALERAINSLQSELSNSGDINYTDSDVGLYNYQHSTSTTMTGLSAKDSWPAGLSYTSGTTVNYAAIAATATYSNNLEDDVTFEGSTVAQGFDYESDGMGAMDLLANNLIPNSGTEYQADSSSGYSGTNASLVMVWE